jgi:hypothetical protein
MKDWRQKLTIDWPCALGDWLWAMLVVEPARLIDKITRRRALHIVGLILLLIFFQQVAMFDLTFLFGFDLGLLMEVAAAIFVLTARNQARTLVETSWRSLKTVARIVRRGRMRENVTRVCHSLLPPENDDEDGLVFA